MAIPVVFSPQSLNFDGVTPGSGGPDISVNPNIALVSPETISFAGGVTIPHAPADAKLTAKITGDTSTFAVRDVSVLEFRLEEVDPIELPHGFTGHPKIRVLEVVGQSDGSAPLAVRKGQLVLVRVQYTAPDSEGTVTGTLVIQGDGWDTVQATISLFIAKVETTFLAAPFMMVQGQQTDLPIVVHSFAGPGTNVSYAMSRTQLHTGISLVPSPTVIHVNSKETKVAILSLQAASDAPLGLNTVFVVQSAFETHRLPLLVNVVPPPTVIPLDHKVERQSRVDDKGVILVTTDNPQVEVALRLIKVHADWAKGDVPQELSRSSLKVPGEESFVPGWHINNADFHLDISNGEEEAMPRPTRAGSLDGKAFAWPAIEGQWTAFGDAEVTMIGRIRVGYKPLTIRLAVSLPNEALAANSNESFQVALDPNVLLVPVEVVRFASQSFPLEGVTAGDQMMLWDRVPILGTNTNVRVTESGTGETTVIIRGWNKWPALLSNGLYTHQGWISPDSIWGKAGVVFRLVNYIEIDTDDKHTAPKDEDASGSSTGEEFVRENKDTALAHPNHIEGVLTVIIMHRIVPPVFSFAEVGVGNLGHNALGISWNDNREKAAVLAHEIGHVMGMGHIDTPNNVMNPPGGTDITPTQREGARNWAGQFANFWQRP